MHKWWARRLGSVLRPILLYSLADENMKVVENGDELFSGRVRDGDPKSLWDFYLEDVDFSGKAVLDPFLAVEPRLLRRYGGVVMWLAARDPAGVGQRDNLR